jgi:hypothetical protein
MANGYSQNPETNNAGSPRILDLEPIIYEDGIDGVQFTIDRSTRGVDVVATLDFMYPDEDLRREKGAALLEYAIESKGYLNLKEVVLEAEVLATDQVEVVRTLRFGDRLTLKDVQDALTKLYGEEHARAGEDRLLCALIDEGLFEGMTFSGTAEHEFATADPDQIALEMDALTERFRKPDGTF